MSDPYRHKSNQDLEAHGRDWAELPVKQAEPVMSDDDTEAHGDILYMRGLLEELTAAKADLEREAKGPDGCYTDAVFWLCWLHRNAATFLESSLTFTPSWGEAMTPLEAVGADIAAWREQLGAVA